MSNAASQEKIQMTTDKTTPYWEQDIVECLRIAADAVGKNSYYLRAAEVIEVLREIRGHNDLLIQDLASLVRRMSYAIAHSNNKNPLIRESIEFLKKHNLGGSVLREMKK